MRKPPLIEHAALALALTACGPTEERVAPMPTSPPTSPAPTSQPAPPSDSAQPEPGSDECGAGKLAAYVSQPFSPEIEARIREAAGSERVRVIRPDDAVTMDHRPDRLNVEIGEDGRIARLRCG